MSRRLEIELTSDRQDGTWTWRAAGAKQPKGVLEAPVLPAGCKVGDVLKVDAEFEIDGITITAVVPSKAPRAERETIQIITAAPPPEELVTSRLVAKHERPAGWRPERGDRPDRGDRGGRPGGGGGGGRGGDRRDRPGLVTRATLREQMTGGAATGSGAPGRGPRPGAPRREGGGGPARREGATGAPRREGAGAPRREGAGAPRGEGSEARGPRREPRRDARPAAATAAPPKPKPKRLNPASTHRNAVLDALPPEQRPVAEQVLRGGVAGVRQAVDAQNAAREEGQPAIKPEALVAMAEDLLPRLKAAEWRDRADAAAAMLDDVTIRDLRSVVAGADAVARDDETRLLASTLRQALDKKLQEQRDGWVGEITKSLDDQRLVRALRISSRPPDPGTRLPAELAVRLTETASTAMGPDASGERWAALLEAVAASPVRRTVKPAGLPAEPGEPLLQLAKQCAGKVPALASLLGIDMPPPPGPPRPPRPKAPPPRPPAPPAPAAPAAPIPPPPPPPLAAPAPPPPPPAAEASGAEPPAELPESSDQ